MVAIRQSKGLCFRSTALFNLLTTIAIIYFFVDFLPVGAT
jgi:hypothetical protein